MDDVIVLLARARAAVAAAESRLAAARHAQWQGIHADRYRDCLAQQEFRVAALEAEVAALHPPPPAP